MDFLGPKVVILQYIDTFRPFGLVVVPKTSFIIFSIQINLVSVVMISRYVIIQTSIE